MFFLITVFLVASVFAADWENHTSRRFAERFRVVGDSLYIVSSGGLTIATDPQTEPVVYLNNDGLNSNLLTDIIIDAQQELWISGKGHLITTQENQFYPYVLFDNDGELLSLTTLTDDNDYLWLGSSFGLVLFSKTIDNGQIQDSYTMFDNLNPEPEVIDILVQNDSIWLATSAGLAWAEKTDLVQLKSPFSWRSASMDSFPEMMSDTVHTVLYHDSAYYIASTRRMFRLSFDLLTDDLTLVPINLGQVTRVHGLQLVNDSLFALYDYDYSPRIAVIENDAHSPLPTAGLPGPPDAIVSYNDRYWVNTINEGIYVWNGSAYDRYAFIGLPGNDVTDVTLDENDTLYTGVRNESFAKNEGPLWNELPIDIGSNTTITHTDQRGQVWLATRGDGVSLVGPDSIIHFDETNSTLFGNNDNIPVSYGFVYISGMADDGQYVFFSCYRAANGFPLVIADLDNLENRSRWDSVGTAQGLNNTFIISLDHGNGRVAVGTESDGVYECTVGDDPFNSPKTCRHLLRENSLLISNTIRVVKYDPNGDLWVGTNVGLSRYDPGIDFFRDVSLPDDISNDVRALDFDSRGNVWIGTPEGLLFLNVTTGEFTRYSMLNSELVADKIQRISFDDRSGRILIATDGGISVIPSQIGAPVTEIEEVLAFPNPFIISAESDRLDFNYAFEATVTIFSVAGEQIIEMPLGPWDGRNGQGKEVASGVYLFSVRNEQGETAVGKFLLVRQ